MVGVSGFLAPLGDGMAMALVLPVPTCRYSLFRGSEAKTRAKLFLLAILVDLLGRATNAL